jgi:hypothetical protein
MFLFKSALKYKVIVQKKIRLGAMAQRGQKRAF